jgi:GntR family transcriptional regulator
MSNWSVRAEPELRSLEDRTVARLRELIRKGTFTPGEQLPSEPELAKRLGVSRPTLRSAIAELVVDRVLVRRRGVGTFVASSLPLLSQGLERLVGTGESLELRGSVPGTTGLEVRHVVATEELAGHLQIETGEPLVQIVRTRTADGVAVMHCEEWIPEDLLPVPASLDDFGTDDSLYSRMAEMRLPIRQAIARFIPLVPDSVLRRRLGSAPGAPVLLLEQEHYLGTEVDRIVLFSKNYYNTQLLELHAVRR